MTDAQQTPVPTINTAGQDAVSLVDKLTKDGESAAETAIIAAEPIMGTFILKQLWEAVFDWLIGYVMTPLAALGGQVVISTEEYFSLKQAVAAQAALDVAKKTGDANAISKASQDVDTAVAGVLHYVGTTHS